MTDKSSKLTLEQFIEAMAMLGPKPPWWRPLKRRRWYAAEWELYQRRDDFSTSLARLYEMVKSLPDEDSRRHR